jgi:ferredoxin--NADP+ reductase
MGKWIEAKIVENRAWNESHFTLTFTAQLPDFKAGQFVRVGLDVDGERVGRPYSCVNAPHEDLFEIYLNVVDEGPLSPRLHELKPGDTLHVWDSLNGLLTVEEVPQETKVLWMCATGTGIGPFISILKTEQAYQRFDKLVLVHAVRYAKDFVYQEQIQSLVDVFPEKLKFVSIVSQSDHDESLKGRIPALIEAGKLEEKAGVAMCAEDTHVMLCGNAGMIADTIEVLAKRDMKKHTRREPGHISTEKYH